MEAVEVSTVMEDLLPVPATGLPPDRFLDRSCPGSPSTTRVLDLAKDAKRVPLLERAKFLAIFSSNLDEFYMVRCRAEASHRGGGGGPNGERDDAPGGALSDPQPDSRAGHRWPVPGRRPARIGQGRHRDPSLG